MHLHIFLSVTAGVVAAGVVAEIDDQLLLLHVFQVCTLFVDFLAVVGCVPLFLALGAGVIQQPGTDDLLGGKVAQIVGAIIPVVAVAAVILVAETAKVLRLLDKSTVPRVVALAVFLLALSIRHGLGILHRHGQLHLGNHIIHIFGIGAAIGGVSPLETVPALDELQEGASGVTIGIPKGVVVAHEIPLVAIEAKGANQAGGLLLLLHVGKFV